MKSPKQFSKIGSLIPQVFNLGKPRWILILHAVSLFIGIFIFAYMGYFSRFIADDYCFASELQRAPLPQALLWRYQNVSDRYTNILFFTLVERIGGMAGMRFFPAVLIALWTIGLFLWLHEMGRFWGIRWPSWIPAFLSFWLVFYALWQAPHRFQILYWYSSSVTHFAPLAFTPFLLTFLTWQARRTAEGGHGSFWLDTLNFLFAFLLGGFSEPPTAMLITAFALVLVITWIVKKGHAWQRPLLWSLIGLASAMLLMILAPANSLRMDAPPPFSLLFFRTLRYPLDFIWDTLVTQPLPSLFTFTGPLLLFLLFKEPFAGSLPRARKARLLILLAILGMAYLFIAASFAPSVYGQSYPMARARFAARVVMTLALMLEGGLLGLILPVRRTTPAALLLLLLAFYPLRASLKMWQSELPTYQQRAVAWDARQAHLFQQIAEGKREIVIEQLNSFQQVKELDSNPRHWVNRCAANYYGVDSIRALPGYRP